jgi:hypothetical protein
MNPQPAGGDAAHPRRTPVITPTHILILGNPVDGFTVKGPFNTAEEAAAHAETRPVGEWWLTTLEPVGADAWQLYADEQGPQRAADLLVAGLTERHTPDDALDDVVHDVASSQASSVNNNGARTQVEYLIEHLGIAAAAAAINDVTRASVGVSQRGYTVMAQTANPALDSDHLDRCMRQAVMGLSETVDPNGVHKLTISVTDDEGHPVTDHDYDPEELGLEGTGDV